MRYLKTSLIAGAFIFFTFTGFSVANPIPFSALTKSGAHPPSQKPHHKLRYASKALAPFMQVAVANRASIQEPKADGYLNAIQVYPFIEGAVYRLYAAPGQVSDIDLQAGEQLVAISAGDTVRWVIGDTTSGSGLTKRTHILVKPTASSLRTNLVVTTSLRTYHLILESTPTTAMVAISWSYPEDALLAHKADEAAAEQRAPVATGLKLENLSFNYILAGDKPAWRPLHVFDDGQRTYVEFPQSLAQGEAPLLFVIGEGGSVDLVNYRVEKNYYVMDRIFDIAELRLGAKRQAIVRITRISGQKRLADADGTRHD